ncbi:MAG: serine hydrolase, partial [Pseudomonadota bacterium]
AGFGWPMRYGAGFMLNKDEVFGPHRDAFGHSGWGGYVAYADPANRLGVGYVMNRMIVPADGPDPRRVRLLEALYDGLGL